MRKRALWIILAAALALPAWAQNPTSPTTVTNVFSATGSSRNLELRGTAVRRHSLRFWPTGTVATCTAKVEKSLDAASWSDLIAGTDCTNPGIQNLTTDTLTNFVRITVTVLSGGGTVTVRYDGYDAVTTASGTGGSGASLVTRGLIADYQFLETSGTALTDSVGGVGSCTLTNAPTRVTHGVSFVAGSSQFASCPAALNAAQTFEIYVSIQSSSIASQATQALIIGNGGGGTAGTAGFVVTLSNAADIPSSKNAQLWTYKDGANRQCPINTWNGTGLATLVMNTGGGGDTIYINGQTNTVLSVCGGTTNGAQTTGVYQIGGAAAGSGFATATFCTCTISRLRAFNVQLTAQEQQQDYLAISADMASYNAPVLMTATDQADIALAVGDSLVVGNGAMSPWPQLAILNNSVTISARGRSGTTSAAIVADYNIMTAPVIRPNAIRTVYSYWAGTNESTAVIAAGTMRNFCILARLQGAKCLLTTGISRGGKDAFIQTMNPLVRNLYDQGYADMIVDLAADALLTPNTSGTSSCFQGDAIHYNTGCSYNNISIVQDAAINSVMGNWTFETGATYASGGTAAIATTNATEAGNTMTFTSAGFTAGMFVPGTRMVCAGITPAGYNGVWQILTNGATTLTAFNTTTGLGGQSVAGTCQGEQLQQADNFATLNSGAVNFMLSSCLDWTGRSVHLFNINAGTTVLVPFNSETLTGSANVVQNAHAILYSKLTSNVSGGCTWVRTQ